MILIGRQRPFEACFSYTTGATDLFSLFYLQDGRSSRTDRKEQLRVFAYASTLAKIWCRYFILSHLNIVQRNKSKCKPNAL